VDALLRKYGMKIYMRYKNSEPVWTKNYKIFFKQSEALQRLPEEEVCDALYEDELYKNWNSCTWE
jgi:hypothetical protein